MKKPMSRAFKRAIVTLFSVALCVGGFFLWIEYDSISHESRRVLDEIASRFNPDNLKLESHRDSRVSSTRIDGIQVGRINIENQFVSFWYRSHHISDDLGSTRFEFSDGGVHYLDGYFCCDVSLPASSLETKSDLLAFIEAKSGSSP
jgi:hypothetical protein